MLRLIDVFQNPFFFLSGYRAKLCFQDSTAVTMILVNRMCVGSIMSHILTKAFKIRVCAPFTFSLPSADYHDVLMDSGTIRGPKFPDH